MFAKQSEDNEPGVPRVVDVKIYIFARSCQSRFGKLYLL